MNRAAGLGAAVAVALLVGGLLAGCTPSVALPNGVTVEIRQTRADGPLHQVQLSVANHSPEPIRVLRAELASTRFDEPVSFTRSQDVPVDSRRNLPVRLSDAVCATGPFDDVVILEFETADGHRGSAAVPVQQGELLEGIRQQDCAVAAVAAIAAITPPANASWMPDAIGPVELEFTVTPTGSADSMTITGFGATTLLTPVDESGARVVAGRLEQVVGPTSEPSTVTVSYEPSRCDPHAIAEDKKGTIIPFTIERDGTVTVVAVPVAPEARAAIYDYVTRWCATAP